MKRGGRRPATTPEFDQAKGALGSDGFVAIGPFLHRTRIEALGVHVAVDELDHRDRGIIAIAIAGLEDSGIAALAVLIAATEHRKELLHLGLVANLRDRLAAGMQVTALGERDQLLDDRPQFLGLGQRGHDLLVLDQRRRHVGEHRLAVAGSPVELTVGVTVAHLLSLPNGSRHGGATILDQPYLAGPRRLVQLNGWLLNSDLRSVWPDRRCSQAANSAHPCRDGVPSEPELP